MDGDLAIWLDADDVDKTYHIRTAPMFCPGYLYVRKGETCRKLYRDAVDVAQYIIEHKNRHPKAFIRGHLLDDPAFFCAMKLNDCICVAEPAVGKCIHYPSFKRRHGHYPNMHFGKGYLEDDIASCSANICHFSSKHTHLGKYRQQVAAMNCYLKGNTMMGRIIETDIVGKCFEAYWKLNEVLQRYMKGESLI